MPVSVRFPLNPLRLERVTVVVAVAPWAIVREVGPDTTLKSGIVTVTAIVVVFVVDPLVPRIVTV